jgi:hypothetical protein
MSANPDNFSEDPFSEDFEHLTRPPGNHRSEPGKGEICNIYWMHPHGDHFLDDEGIDIGERQGREDYAVTPFEVVVKVKPSVTKAELAECLRIFANYLTDETRPLDDELRKQGLI